MTVAELLQIKRRCPLTFTFVEGSALVGKDGVPSQDRIDSAPCIGVDCTFFAPNASPETGEIIGGNCAVPVLAVALSNLTAMVGASAPQAPQAPRQPFRRAPPLAAVPSPPKGEEEKKD